MQFNEISTTRVNQEGVIMSEETYWAFMESVRNGEEYTPKEIIRFFPTADGKIDVKIAEGTELTEAAALVIEAIRNAGNPQEAA